jgi:hypothetical protein
VERRLNAGSVLVTRGGKNLLRKRNNLADAGLTEARWRQEWEASRLFLTADGEAAKLWGNETIRVNHDEGWLELKLPAPLAGLANRPSGRYRLACAVKFSYRGDEVAAQASTGAVRYDISTDPKTGRWHIDASWKKSPAPAVTLNELQAGAVVAVDVNAGHLDAAVIAANGSRQAIRPDRPTGPRQATRRPKTVRGRPPGNTHYCAVTRNGIDGANAARLTARSGRPG